MTPKRENIILGLMDEWGRSLARTTWLGERLEAMLATGADSKRVEQLRAERRAEYRNAVKLKSDLDAFEVDW